MRSLTCGLILLLSIGSVVRPAGVGAQTLRPGDRARIAIREAQPQDETPAQRRIILRGEVIRVNTDSLFLRVPGAAGELGILLPTALSVHRSRGVRSRPASALRSGVGLAVAGALFFGLTYGQPERDFGVINRGEAFALGAGIGAVTGIVLGALLPTERWQRVCQ